MHTECMQLTTSEHTNTQKHPHPNQKNLLILILQLLALAESFITNFPWLCSLLTSISLIYIKTTLLR